MASREKGVVPGVRTLVAQTDSEPSQVRQDFTYKKAAGLDLANGNFRQSLFIGAILENCRFRSTNFDRCDFSGTKLVGCVFEDCTFIPDEIRSCAFQNCIFRRCDFRGSQWQRIEVEHSLFDHCDFRETSFRECAFSGAQLDACPFKRSSVTLCRFDKCRFHKIQLGDCTALYLFFDHCSFEECRMNAETLGFTYGLSSHDVDRMGLLYLGRRQEKPKSVDFVEALIANYWHRKWYVGACVLELNFQREMPVIAMRRLVDALNQLIDEKLPFDWDELRFFMDVIDRLQSEDRLPLLGLWRFLEALNRIDLAARRNHQMTGVALSAQFVISRASQMLLDTLDQLINVNDLLDANPLWLELKLGHKPNKSLGDLVPSKVFKAYEDGMIVYIAGHEGSWTEIWQVSIGSLAAIQLALVAINGVLRQAKSVTDNLRRLIRSFRSGRLVSRRGSRTSKKSSFRKLTKRGGSVAGLLSANIEVTRIRLESLPLQSLVRIESAIRALNHLDDEQLTAFREYDHKQLQSVSIRKAKSRARAGRQARPPAA